jgi:arylsulfatase A-like enzyme
VKNILFIMTDDHTVNEMGCYGAELPPTPNLDRIAAQGTRFDRAFCTNALCAPSRATVLTGCFSHVHGIRGNSEGADGVETLNPDVPTFPALLQKAGYRTGLVGKYHIRQAPGGFDHWIIHPGQGEYFDPVFIDNGVERTIEGYATDITGDLALEFLDGIAPSQPFCLVYQFKAPHRPFTPAPRHANLFADVEPQKPPTYNDDYSSRALAAVAEDMRFDVSLAPDYGDEIPTGLSCEARKDWIFRRFMQDRWRTIVAVDENVGRVLDWLDESGRADDTLVVYTSDHGYFLGDHGWYDKRFMYEPAMRIPLVACCPCVVPAGTHTEALAMNVDICPTILDFAGIDIPSAVQGRSLRPLMADSGTPTPQHWRESVYYAYYEDSWRLRDRPQSEMAEPGFQYFTPHRIGPHRGVRSSRYKLIEYFGEGPHVWEFFDLQVDPDELVNRYDDPASQHLVARLKEELRRLRQQYDDAD